MVTVIVCNNEEDFAWKHRNLIHSIPLSFSISFVSMLDIFLFFSHKSWIAKSKTFFFHIKISLLSSWVEDITGWCGKKSLHVQLTSASDGEGEWEKKLMLTNVFVVVKDDNERFDKCDCAFSWAHTKCDIQQKEEA